MRDSSWSVHKLYLLVKQEAPNVLFLMETRHTEESQGYWNYLGMQNALAVGRDGLWE